MVLRDGKTVFLAMAVSFRAQGDVHRLRGAQFIGVETGMRPTRPVFCGHNRAPAR